MHRFVLQLLLGPQATGKQNDLSDQVLSRRPGMWGSVTSLGLFLGAAVQSIPFWEISREQKVLNYQQGWSENLDCFHKPFLSTKAGSMQ